MLKSSASCPTPNYSHIVHSLEGVTSLAPQLNYLTDLVLELKAKLAKIKAEVKENWEPIKGNSSFSNQWHKTLWTIIFKS